MSRSAERIPFENTSLNPCPSWGRWQASLTSMNVRRLAIGAFVVIVLVWLTLLTFPDLVPRGPCVEVDRDDPAYPMCG